MNYVICQSFRIAIVNGRETYGTPENYIATKRTYLCKEKIGQLLPKVEENKSNCIFVNVSQFKKFDI